MDTKSMMVLSASLLAAGALLAVPVVREDSVIVTQKSQTRRVTIDYTLENEPGIVTVDVRTNGVSIGGENLYPVSGDVHHIIQPGDRRIYWQPDATWGAEEIKRINVTAVVTAWATNAPPDYMAIDLQKEKGWGNVFFYVDAESVPGGITNSLYKSTWLLMRRIHATDVLWSMGSPADEPFRSSDNSETLRYITLSEDYYIGVYPTTVRQFELGTGIKRDKYNPYGLGDEGPVSRTNHNGLRGSGADGDWPTKGHDVGSGSIIDKIRAKTGLYFDLPTEAQWEYACRAGTHSGLYTGKEVTSGTAACPNVDEIAWYADHGASPQTVGMLGPNAWGLYDLVGNVAEACLDWASTDVSADSAIDPTGPGSGTQRIAKGGYYGSKASGCRSAARMYYEPDKVQKSGAMGPNELGFRLCCPIGLVK